MKKLSFIQTTNERHWVGDGFPVRSIFSYNDRAEEMSPFLLLDYAGPKNFPPTKNRLGVGEHPHRGFETVTIVYDGEVEHRDSSGGGGKIGPGDVQWMTAASGIVHEEFHGTEFAKNGGPFEMIQLWVNLPKKDKSAPSGYQSITSTEIPKIEIPGGSVRVIAGQYNDRKGPAHTFTPMNVFDVRLQAGKSVEFNFKEGHTTAAFVLKGSLKLASGENVGEASIAVFERDGEKLKITADQDATVLILNGEPINEPIVAYGPFVMNTETEIKQAFRDYQSGKMGHLA
jgi:redox-sensitive bicupin YhaK (pirin superfamily)